MGKKMYVKNTLKVTSIKTTIKLQKIIYLQISLVCINKSIINA